MSQAYCGTCGNKISNNEKFCAKCGTLNPNYQQKSENIQNDRMTKVQSGRLKEEKTSVSKPKGPKKPNIKIIIGAVIALILVVVGASYIGYEKNLSKAAQVKQMTSELKTNDADRISKVLYNEKEKGTPDTTATKPLVKFLKKHKQYVANNEGKLADSGVTHDGTFKVKEVGKLLVVFPRYKLTYVPQEVAVETDSDDLVPEIDGVKLTESSKGSAKFKYTPLVPGTYTIKASGDVSGKAVNLSSDENLGINESPAKLRSAQVIKLAQKSFSFTIVSNVKEARVLIDGHKVGRLANGKFEAGPFFNSDSVEIELKKDNDESESKDVDPSEYDGEDLRIDFSKEKSSDKEDSDTNHHDNVDSDEENLTKETLYGTWSNGDTTFDFDSSGRFKAIDDTNNRTVTGDYTVEDITQNGRSIKVKTTVDGPHPENNTAFETYTFSADGRVLRYNGMELTKK